MLLEQEANEQYTPKLITNFNWYETNFTPCIENAFSSFWEQSFQIKLIGAIDNNFSLFKTEEFFVTKLVLKKNLYAAIRIPKSTIGMMFECLGETRKKFDLTKITELEAKIINSFNDYTFNEFKSLLTIPDKKYYEEPENVNLIFAIKDEKNNIYRYIVTIPKESADIPEFEKEEDFPLINIDDFAKTTATVNIEVGSAKMSLNELKNLTEEDIVILDDSNLNKMKLRIGDEETFFELSPDPLLIMNVDDNGDNGTMDNSTLSQDMWDNIQVEIGAEFDKIKISLGELKQISEGLVVDIGSIYQNKIFLKVENKNIAQGELVIINDRYGVKIDKVFNDDDVNENDDENEIKSNQNEENIESETEEESSQDDFDYSDFEIEDDNI